MCLWAGQYLKLIFSVRTPLLLCCLLAAFPLQASNFKDDDSNIASTEVDQLFQLIDQRLGLMEGVATYKYANDIPVENKQREELVLDSAIANGRQHQLKPASVDAFFRLQIDLAKTIQKGWIQRWQADGKAPSAINKVADLNGTIRPALIQLGQQIVAQIPLALPELHDRERQNENRGKAEKAITNPFVSSAMKQALLNTMLAIELEEQETRNHLATILQRGVLRVGTTGDYKPFSFIEQPGANYAGIDIDLARNLAHSLGVKLQLVKTSWPTLMADLERDQFDVGMSGISRTLLRQRTAFFSVAYFTGGKTPIARCGALAQLNSLSKIDRTGVRVIVNPGGTNEKFVHATIKDAQIIIHPDNTTIFEQILNKQADVMITDDIEVKLQQGLHPELCATMPGELFAHVDKAFLMPQDIALKEYIDSWLEQVKHGGQLAAAFARYIGASDTRTID